MESFSRADLFMLQLRGLGHAKVLLKLHLTNSSLLYSLRRPVHLASFIAEGIIMRSKGQCWIPECYGKVGDINIYKTSGIKVSTLPYHLHSPRLISNNAGEWSSFHSRGRLSWRSEALSKSNLHLAPRILVMIDKQLEVEHYLINKYM